jgi:hypothetical protein
MVYSWTTATLPCPARKFMAADVRIQRLSIFGGSKNKERLGFLRNVTGTAVDLNRAEVR